MIFSIIYSWWAFHQTKYIWILENIPRSPQKTKPCPMTPMHLQNLFKKNFILHNQIISKYMTKANQRVYSRALSVLGIGIDVLTTIVDWGAQVTWLYSLFLVKGTCVSVWYTLTLAFAIFWQDIRKDLEKLKLDKDFKF